PDERRRIRKVGALRRGIEREEVEANRPSATSRSTETARALAGERVEAIVDGDLVASADRPPREDRRPATHRVRLARVMRNAPAPTSTALRSRSSSHRWRRSSRVSDLIALLGTTRA